MEDIKEVTHEFFIDRPNGGQNIKIIDIGPEYEEQGRFSIEIEDYGDSGLSSSQLRINCLNRDKMKKIADMINDSLLIDNDKNF